MTKKEEEQEYQIDAPESAEVAPIGAKKRRIIDLSEAPPGEKVLIGKRGKDGRGALTKVPWTMKHIKARFKDISVLPEETMSLTWNGVTVNVFEGIEDEIPEPHYEMYKERMKEAHKPKAPIILIGGQAVSVRHGAGLQGMPENPERGKLDLYQLAKDIEKRRTGE